MKHRQIARYGWRPQIPDRRDHVFSAPLYSLQTLPPALDLTVKCPPVYDQGALGSCTANAICGAVEFDLRRINPAHEFTPSRLFVYYNGRAMERSTTTDSGASLRDGIKCVAKLGVPPEKEWPYSDQSPGSFQQQPTANVYKNALKHKVTSYQAVSRSGVQMKGCLAAGFPFVFGMTVYNSFETSVVEKTGVVPMPSHSEDIVGGHAMLVVGYDDSKSRFLVRNSWGKHWGMAGYCTIAYEYFLDPGLSSDFWTLRAVMI